MWLRLLQAGVTLQYFLEVLRRYPTIDFSILVSKNAFTSESFLSIHTVRFS